MRTKSRQRIFRSLLATILDSDLSPADIRDLSKELQSGPLSWELGHALEMLAGQLSVGDTHSLESSDPTDDLQVALQLVKRRRIAKSKLGQIVKSLDHGMPLRRIEEVTIEEFLREFLSSATAAERSQLLSILDTPTKDDPYLAGIMKRIR
ncbi:hypothetical protein [Phenylobacterium aquaticum]|uniref:hypothetical protein n=1 Tax=Phenylobacterium aquaticum TaxID=1763816 RepID=UPI001F5C9BFE|nr:hypothetical protein [Phenylobacterium aquaticum]MCI3134005.1 hypothetical protein [Phenylobacterium aquaticum]